MEGTVIWKWKALTFAGEACVWVMFRGSCSEGHVSLFRSVSGPRGFARLVPWVLGSGFGLSLAAQQSSWVEHVEGSEGNSIQGRETELGGPSLVDQWVASVRSTVWAGRGGQVQYWWFVEGAESQQEDQEDIVQWEGDQA